MPLCLAKWQERSGEIGFSATREDLTHNSYQGRKSNSGASLMISPGCLFAILTN